MPGPVCNEGDQVAIGCTLSRLHPIEVIAYGLHDLEIRTLRPAAHVVALARLAAFQDRDQRPGMILHIEPVPHVSALAIDGQRTPQEGVRDHQRDEFFRKVIRPVVIGAVGQQNRQSIGAVPCDREMIRGRLAGRVGRAWIVPRLFGEGAGLTQAAENLVRGNMQKPEAVLARARQGLPVFARGFKERTRADHVRGDESCRPAYGPIDVEFGREMNDCIRLRALENAPDILAVTDVEFMKNVTGLPSTRRKRSRDLPRMSACRYLRRRSHAPTARAYTLPSR